jgi:hypothetical protein
MRRLIELASIGQLLGQVGPNHSSVTESNGIYIPRKHTKKTYGRCEGKPSAENGVKTNDKI